VHWVLVGRASIEFCGFVAHFVQSRELDLT
jgi:hypothetical protein